MRPRDATQSVDDEGHDRAPRGHHAEHGTHRSGEQSRCSSAAPQDSGGVGGEHQEVEQCDQPHSNRCQHAREGLLEGDITRAVLTAENHRACEHARRVSIGRGKSAVAQLRGTFGDSIGKFTRALCELLGALRQGAQTFSNIPGTALQV